MSWATTFYVTKTTFSCCDNHLKVLWIKHWPSARTISLTMNHHKVTSLIKWWVMMHATPSLFKNLTNFTFTKFEKLTNQVMLIISSHVRSTCKHLGLQSCMIKIRCDFKHLGLGFIFSVRSRNLGMRLGFMV
jgi:hypothetical protein